MKKITIVTGTRAEFGILSPLIKKVQEDKNYDLKLVVTGMHLSPEFGYTIEEIKSAGFAIDKKVECLISSDTAVGVSKSIGVAILGFADALEELKPDLIFVLGDRTEILAAVIAATMANIPIAHLHGGETTEGAYDESIRHAITKMSYWHFVSTEIYKKRVIQLGEEPNRVFNVGALGLDSIKNLKLLSKQELETTLQFELGKKNILITYHPVTLEDKTAKNQFQTILDVLDKLENTKLIFTYANSDKDGRIINGMIKEYVQVNKNKAIAFKSLGQFRYFSTLQHVDLVLGNSSSGILEVPYFNIPTVNIGDRQKGRLSPESVIQCPPDRQKLAEAIERAFNPAFIARIKTQQQLYGNGNTTEKIMGILEKNTIKNLKKPFYDIPFQI